jgi:hypothetical protein
MNNTSTDTNTTATDQLRNCQLPKWSMDAAQTLRREPHTMKKSQTKKQDRAVNSLYSTRRAPLDNGI